MPFPPVHNYTGYHRSLIRHLHITDTRSTTATTVEPRTWVAIGSKLECDGDAGEISLDSSRGKVPTLEACKQSCEDATGCKSISYYKTKWCSHFSTSCTNTKWSKKAAMSLRWILDSEIPPATTTPPGSYWQIIRSHSAKFVCS